MKNINHAKAAKLIEKIVAVRKHSRTIKGGRIMSFSALVVVGDGTNLVGFGRGKALEVPVSIQKALNNARKNMMEINIRNGTIWYPITCRHGATSVYLQPAAPGTGLVAGNAVRSVLEAVGIQNILSKIHGSSNPMNVVRATMKGLSQMKSAKFFAEKRGIKIMDMFSTH